VHIVVRSQNIALQPSIPVELGETAQLKEISHNYYVIYHQDARTPVETPSIAAAHCLDSLHQQAGHGDALLRLTNFVDPVEPVAILSESQRQLRPKLPSQRDT
jgi:hypothetical protein